MIGVIFNRHVHDDPYKQYAVNKGVDKLYAICDRLSEHLAISWSDNKRSFWLAPDLTDDYVIVHYTADLTDENKAEIANCIKEILTLKKTLYKNELPEIHIVFSKIPKNDYYCFNVE